MATRARTVTVGTTPTLLTAADQDNNPEYRDLAVRNTSAVRIHLGGSAVTTADGFPVEPGESFAFDRLARPDLPYAIATEPTVVRVIEVGV